MNIDEMTVQEAVDYSVKKIVEQGSQCMDTFSNTCAYSNNKGQHCVIGWLLNHDDDKLMNHEGTVNDLINTMEDELPKIIINNEDIFENLQMFHDGYLATFRIIFKNILKEEGIDVSGKHFQEWIDLANK